MKASQVLPTCSKSDVLLQTVIGHGSSVDDEDNDAKPGPPRWFGAFTDGHGAGWGPPKRGPKEKSHKTIYT